MKLDILIPQAQMGGAENAINTVRMFCESKGWNFNAIKLENESYIDKKLSGGVGKPDIAIAYNMPSGVYAIKNYSEEVGAPITAVSWLDASVGNINRMEQRDFVYLGLADIHFVSGRQLHSEIRTLFPDSRIFDVVGMGELPNVSEYEKLDKNAHFISEAGFDNVGGALADFECKLREIVGNPESILKIKEYGNLYCGDKISVIIPCYNVENYVGECIESLVASSLPLYMMEFIFVDDASKDDTRRVIKRYEAEYPDNILLVECEQNGGISIARNIGMQYASGNYIGYVDSDDMVDRDMYRKLYEKIALYQCDMSSCGFYVYVSEEDKKIGEFPSENLYLLDDTDIRKNFMLGFGMRANVWKRVYRRKFLEDNKIDFPEHLRFEDNYFTPLCAMCAERCYVISEPLYMYRTNPDSIMNSGGMSEYYVDEYYVMEKLYNEMKCRGFLDEYEEECGFLYYSKALAVMVQRMTASERIVKVNWDNLNMVKKSIFEHFPNILKNPYVNDDKTDFNQWILSFMRV
jgi:glycosyltransferase involved in cell wall biosynthesis